jgi:hypothetical protein
MGGDPKTFKDAVLDPEESQALFMPLFTRVPRRGVLGSSPRIFLLVTVVVTLGRRLSYRVGLL